MSKRFIIHKDDSIRRANAIAYIDGLPNREWSIEIKAYTKKRSLEQNAYIHGVPLKLMSDHTGYTIEEIKEFMCGEFSGWEEYQIFGETRTRPVQTTSQMNTADMSAFIEFLQWYGSHHMNLYIPSPNEWSGEY